MQGKERINKTLVYSLQLPQPPRLDHHHRANMQSVSSTVPVAGGSTPVHVTIALNFVPFDPASKASHFPWEQPPPPQQLQQQHQTQGKHPDEEEVLYLGQRPASPDVVLVEERTAGPGAISKYLAAHADAARARAALRPPAPQNPEVVILDASPRTDPAVVTLDDDQATCGDEELVALPPPASGSDLLPATPDHAANADAEFRAHMRAEHWHNPLPAELRGEYQKRWFVLQAVHCGNPHCPAHGPTVRLALRHQQRIEWRP